MNILLTIPFIIFSVIIHAFFVMPFMDINSVANTAITAIMSFISSMGGMLLTIYVYAEIREITKKFARKTSLICLIFNLVCLSYDIIMAIIYPETREWFLIALWIVTTPVFFFIMRKLLLRKAAQHELMEGSEPS